MANQEYKRKPEWNPKQRQCPIGMLDAEWDLKHDGTRSRTSYDRAGPYHKNAATSSSSGRWYEEDKAGYPQQRVKDGRVSSSEAWRRVSSSEGAKSKERGERYESSGWSSSTTREGVEPKQNRYEARYATRDEEGSANKKFKGAEYERPRKAEDPRGEENAEWSGQKRYKKEAPWRAYGEESDRRRATEGDNDRETRKLRVELHATLKNDAQKTQAWIAFCNIHNTEETSHSEWTRAEVDPWKAEKASMVKFLSEVKQSGKNDYMERLISKSKEIRSKAVKYAMDAQVRRKWEGVTELNQRKPPLCRFYMMEKCRGVRCTEPHDTTALAATRERRRMQPQELRGRCQLAPMGWECTRAACIGNHNTEELTEMALPGDKRCDTCCQIHLPWTVQTDICRHCNKVMREEPTKKR